MADLLLDTCTFLWLTSCPARLSAPARAALDDDNHRAWLSDVSIWEVCLKWQAGKIELPTPPRMWFDQQIRMWSVERLKIEQNHFFRSTELPTLHRDPFDRLLVAQALEQTLTIVTPDDAIAAYPVAVTW